MISGVWGQHAHTPTPPPEPKVLSLLFDLCTPAGKALAVLRACRRDMRWTGEYVLLADRWHTCFFDLSGDQGLLGQAGGRTADDAAYWLAQAAPAWRDAIQVVAIDMCSIYASAVRRVLPRARIAVDLFHVVHLAVKMTGDVRRWVARGKYGRRGRSGDPGYGIKNLLTRNLEHLSPGQFAKVIATLDADAAGQEIAAAWIGKEKLRHALNLRARITGSAPCERYVRDRLFAFLRLVHPER
jgi:transposase